MAQIQAPTVLFLASWYPTPINKSHGIFIKNHAIALSKFINVVVVYAYANPQTVSYELQTNVVSQNFTEYLIAYKKINSISFGSKLPLISQLQKLTRFKNAYKLLLKTLIHNNINVTAIQLNVLYPSAICLSIFKNYFKVKHTVVEHWSGYLPEDGNYNGFFVKYFSKKALTNASKIFYVSEKQKLAMQSHSLIGNYELIYNVVNTNIFKIDKKLKNTAITFLHVSTLDYDQKNILGTLNSLKKLQENNYNFNSVFIGGDEENINYFKRKAQQLNLNNIHFAGHKTQHQIAELMQQTHALILFSNYENMPVVVLEALACGLPVFASNVGQLSFFINDSFGRLVDVGDEEKLTQQLQLFLDGKLIFNSDKMVEFIQQNATFDVVGKKLAEEYIN